MIINKIKRDVYLANFFCLLLLSVFVVTFLIILACCAVNKNGNKKNYRGSFFVF